MNSAGTDFKKFTVEEIVARMPEQYRGVLKKNLNEKIKSGKKVRVYCDGVFDMFHFGHMRMLKQIKDLIPNVYLIAGVCTDEDIVKHKGSNIMNETERRESVQHCKWVDEIYYPAPWSYEIEFLENMNVDFVAHDVAPYGADGTGDVYAPMKKTGM